MDAALSATPIIRKGSAIEIPAILATDAHRTDKDRRELVERAVRDGECWVADVGGRILGYLIVDTRFYQQPFIWLLVVDAGARRRGIGSALVRYAIGLHSQRRVFTSTNESNEPSRRLFESLGFEPAGRIDALEEGDPELVLVRRP